MRRWQSYQRRCVGKIGTCPEGPVYGLTAMVPRRQLNVQVRLQRAEVGTDEPIANGSRSTLRAGSVPSMGTSWPLDTDLPRVQLGELPVAPVCSSVSSAPGGGAQAATGAG